MELSIVMPCLNEAETLETCIKKALGFLERENVQGEVLVADNGSTDGSQEIARKHGVRVISVETKGYGAALKAGIQAADGKFVVMGDADDSYDFVNLSPFLEKLRAGYDLVMGNRFKGGIAKGAMPPLHKYLGNPVLTFIGRLFFKSPVKDFHCGLRGFNKSSIDQLKLQTTGMEFASEMVVKATLNGLKMTEVPTTLSPDGRNRAPHLNSWRDGWRHLRFLLIFSPRWLFLYPGMFLFMLGVFGLLTLFAGPVTIGNVTFDVNTMLFMSTFIILGVQSISFSLFAKFISIKLNIIPKNKKIEDITRVVTLEKGLVLGLIFIVLGLVGSIVVFAHWGGMSFGQLDSTKTMRFVIPSVTSITVGLQMILNSFFMSVLRLNND